VRDIFLLSLYLYTFLLISPAQIDGHRRHLHVAEVLPNRRIRLRETKVLYLELIGVLGRTAMKHT
jgi:hypothetical protein